ncbi:MAG: asparagine synthase (glutamine-hydrolyzing), partial [Arenimonas sp.]
MCGIAGIIAYHPVAPDVKLAELQRIRDHMAARGPDGKGEWISPDGRNGFGHRRLSIIDLSERGAQPMARKNGKLVITFNGEIYNYRELRIGLEKKGYLFESDSDTEVLLHLYDDQGAAMLPQLRGMFSFAIWDADKQATLLARDPYGIKPLYYADDGWTLRFASQVKALLAGGNVSCAPEPAGAVGFYLLGSIPDPYTLYQDIRALPAGSYLWVTRTGASAPVHYFTLADIWQQAENYSPTSTQELQEKVREAVFDSVKHHLIADVPVGAFLSAGLDSGAIVGLMSEMQKNISTLTLSFSEYQGRADDEAPLAAQVAALYGTQHAQHSIANQEFINDLPAILQAMDQPSIDGINSWFVSKATRAAGLKVAISGLGGDELFGGYPSFRDIPRWRRALWLPAKIPGLGRVAETAMATFKPLFSSFNPKAASMLRYGG